MFTWELAGDYFEALTNIINEELPGLVFRPRLLPRRGLREAGRAAPPAAAAELIPKPPLGAEQGRRAWAPGHPRLQVSLQAALFFYVRKPLRHKWLNEE